MLRCVCLRFSIVLLALVERQRLRRCPAAADQLLLSPTRHDAIRFAYDRFRRSSADLLFETLPKGERGIIEGLARASSSSSFAATNGSFAKTMFDIAKARITAERHADKVPTFEQWSDIRQAP